MADDYYRVLGVEKDASQDEIKKAYRELAMKYHPDRNQGKDTEEHFKKVNEAYAVLGDPDKRKQYDAYGPDQFGKVYSQEDIFRNFDIGDVLRKMGVDFGFSPFGNDDMFSSMFGFGNQRGGDLGNDILARIDITLEQAAFGTGKEINVRHVARCETCKGNGAEPGSKIVTCSKCGGSGQLRQTRSGPFGVMQTITICPKCGGQGKAPSKLCARCGGSGKRALENRIKVTIPKGIETGTRLRVRGMGDYGRDRTGDLYVDVNVMKDKRFRREGDRIYTDVRVPFHVAALGGAIKVPTLYGEREAVLEEGTQSDSTVTLKGQGMPHFNSPGMGDEIARIVVEIPRHLTKEQKDLLEKLSGFDDHKRKKQGKFGIF